MKSRVNVTIAGQEYAFLSEENEEYIHRVAAFVDEKIRDTMENGHASALEGAVLTGVNIADEYFKALEMAENLRVQLKDYLEETTRTKAELSELRREMTRLRRDA